MILWYSLKFGTKWFGESKVLFHVLHFRVSLCRTRKTEGCSVLRSHEPWPFGCFWSQSYRQNKQGGRPHHRDPGGRVARCCKFGRAQVAIDLRKAISVDGATKSSRRYARNILFEAFRSSFWLDLKMLMFKTLDPSWPKVFQSRNHLPSEDSPQVPTSEDGKYCEHHLRSIPNCWFHFISLGLSTCQPMRRTSLSTNLTGPPVALFPSFKEHPAHVIL